MAAQGLEEQDGETRIAHVGQRCGQMRENGHRVGLDPCPMASLTRDRLQSTWLLREQADASWPRPTHMALRHRGTSEAHNAGRSSGSRHDAFL